MISSIPSSVNVLGTTYKVIQATNKEDLKLVEVDGYCDFSTKEIVIEIYDEEIRNDRLALKDLDVYAMKCFRHEVIHAFLYESGLAENSLNQWAMNEEIVDWFALQLPKIVEALKGEHQVVQVFLDNKLVAEKIVESVKSAMDKVVGCI